MGIDTTAYQLLNPQRSAYLLAMIGLLLLTAVGGYCAYNMEHEGHHITGMTNRIVWGLPHVFAVSLILAASGALNGATLSSVFKQSNYKPYARLSAVLAITLLIGGLLVLVLDLGRPDRLSVAMSHYNFRSIFSWNIFLYTGFIAICIVYLSTMLDRKFNRFTDKVGMAAFIWRIVLTTGTGCIFGFLVGRSALDSAILAPLFIVLSFVMGSAILAMVMMLVSRWQDSSVPVGTLESLRSLLFWCLLGLVYFSCTHHLTNLYVAEHKLDEQFVLGGPFSLLFWLGHIGIGIVLPLVLLVRAKKHNTDNNTSALQTSVLYSCIAALLGGAVLVYIIIIGSQSTAQNLFPGKTVIASSFGDAGIAVYSPSFWEWGLGIGGVAFALLLLGAVLRVLPISPRTAPS